MEKDGEKGAGAKRADDFSKWYVDVLTRSGFIDYSDVSGAMVLRPAAYFAWQKISEVVDKKFRESGIENVYFPLFIPERFLKMEQEHFEGFMPEVAWVTEAGNSKLNERLAVRPTSEAIMYPSYSKWVRSWRDLPIRYNQWNNVVRWEFKHPMPFIRTREFLWNEGHSAFATEEEARKEKDEIIKIYVDVLREYLALPGIVGLKSEHEKFAGAVESYSIEHIMPDGWAIQGPDFHIDGQNFSKPFDIKFLDREGKTAHAWQNTFAITTREIGIMIATHGDDRGLVMPPKLAYVQIVIVPIYKDESKDRIMAYARKIEKELKGRYRVVLDKRDTYSPGFKFNEWELKGVPIRIEVGPKDVEADKAVVVRRDTLEKRGVQVESISKEMDKLMEDINVKLYEKASAFLKRSIHEVDDYREFKRVLDGDRGFVSAQWCGSTECEAKVKEETGAKITNVPITERKLEKGRCIYCGKDAKARANFARSY